MPESRLRRILAELHEGLEAADDLDDGARDALRGAADEIWNALDKGAPETDGTLGRSVSERMSKAVGRFEGSHPRLTEAVRRVVDQLAEMGI
ncbi:MAG: DUF4404 family protein [Proteobacteria bacterium]|nr:DUF4404 family protein [Pseudomonadota bacterium]